MSKAKTKQSLRVRYLKRHIVEASEHPFIGRVFDLSIVGFHFDSYEALAAHADCKYVMDVNFWTTTLVERVESLNLAGNLIWVGDLNYSELPISHYEWLVISADVLLMRLISVADCALILINEVFEYGLSPRECSLNGLRRKGASEAIIRSLESLLAGQVDLRVERNARFHHGIERAFTENDSVFKTASFGSHRYRWSFDRDANGRRIDLRRYQKQGLVGLQRSFNKSSKQLTKDLDSVYDLVSEEFERRFSKRFKERTHDFGVSGGRASSRLK